MLKTKAIEWCDIYLRIEYLIDVKWPKKNYQLLLLQVPSSSDFAFFFLENLTKSEELLSLNCIVFNIVGDAGSSYTTELERSLSGQSSLDLQENKVYCILGNIHPCLFSPLLPLLSVGEFKTGRIPLSQLILFLKHNFVWANSRYGKTVFKYRSE